MNIVDLANEVRDLAETQPNGCGGISYYNEVMKRPCCILGVAAFALDKNLEYNVKANRKVIGSEVTREWLGITTEDIRRNYSDYVWLQQVQFYQDAGFNWEDSVRKADEYVDSNLECSDQ